MSSKPSSYNLTLRGGGEHFNRSQPPMLTNSKTTSPTSPAATSTTDELLDVLDPNGHKTGQVKSRRLVHRDGDWHRAVDIWIVNPDLGILIQRRTDHKDSWPGYWDISCGGHLTTGDDSLSGAVRELTEELGLEVEPSDLHFLTTTRSTTHPSPDFINNSFNDLYLLWTDKTLADLTLQESEVAALQFVSPAELQEMLDRTPSPLAPHPEFYDIILDIMSKKY